MKTALFAAAVVVAYSSTAAAQGRQTPTQPVPSLMAAQETLTPGQTLRGSVAQNQKACYLLQTTAGSQWRVALRGPMFEDFHNIIEVGRGSCERLDVDRTDDTVGSLNYTSAVEFAAGGGVYVIRVQGYGGRAGNYGLTAEQRSGLANQNLLPAGQPSGPWLTPGWTPASVSSAPAAAGEGLAVGNVFKDCADICPELVVVSAGAFTMGSPAEEVGRTSQEAPRHAVAFRSPFAIGRYEVTFSEYDACVAAGGCVHRPNDQGWGRGRRPVVDVSWNDAMAYVAWLSAHTGRRYSLPSEAEWEYAARAGADTPWQTGRAILTDDANILNAFGKTVPVGAYPPNAFGLHDVHGNVSEFVLDCRDVGYVGAPNNGSASVDGDCSAARVSRGGHFADEPANVRSATRKAGPQIERWAGVGFRVARAL